MNTQPRMFVRTAAGLALAVAGVVSLGCAAHKPAPQVVESIVDHPAVSANASAADRSLSRDDQQSVILRKGQKLVVRLAGEPPRGYAWQITGSDWGNGVVEIDDRTTQIDDSGTAVYNFRAVKPGQGTITFGCENPWDRGSVPAKRLVVMVDVE